MPQSNTNYMQASLSHPTRKAPAKDFIFSPLVEFTRSFCFTSRLILVHFLTSEGTYLSKHLLILCQNYKACVFLSHYLTRIQIVYFNVSKNFSVLSTLLNHHCISKGHDSYGKTFSVKWYEFVIWHSSLIISQIKIVRDRSQRRNN